MYNEIVILHDKDDSRVPLQRVASTIKHRATTEWQYVAITPTAKKQIDINAKVYILVGTKVINSILGSVRGRNAAIKKENIWYITLPNINLLHIDAQKIATAKQLIRAITILDNIETYSYPKVEVYVLKDVNEVRQMVDEALKSHVFAFDFETNAELLVHSPTFRATCLSITYTPHFSWIIPENLLYNADVIIELSRLFISDIIKGGHNIQFDIKILWKLGIKTKGRYFCTKLMSFMIDENTSNGLKECIDTYLPEYSGYDYGVSFIGDTDKLYQYAAIDTHCTLLLYCMFIRDIVEDEYFYPLYRSLYLPAMEVLAKMEYEGALVDESYLDERIEYIEADIERRTKDLQQIAEVKRFIIYKQEDLASKAAEDLYIKITKKKEENETNHWILKWQEKLSLIERGEVTFYDEFDMGSPKVLGEFLYTDKGLNLPQPLREERDSRGKKKLVATMSTDAEALNDIDHPITETIKILRSLKQLLNTFYRSIREKSINSRIYANFNQIGAVTGRSCVKGDTVIKTDVGNLTIKDIVDNKIGCKVLTHKGRYQKVINWWEKGQEVMYEVCTESGKSITCTLDHKFLTTKGWLSLKDILSLPPETSNKVSLIIYE